MSVPAVLGLPELSALLTAPAGRRHPMAAYLWSELSKYAIQAGLDVRDDPYRLLYGYTGTLPVKFIDLDGKPYIERYFLSHADGMYSYLHRFVSGDAERHLHNHPWASATSLLLTGAYTELRGRVHEDRSIARKVGRLRYVAGDFNSLDRLDIHRIISAERETWTLFSHTDWIGRWGFYRLDRQGRVVDYRDEDDTPYSSGWWKRAVLGRDSRRLQLR